jgi:hypothetical protein
MPEDSTMRDASAGSSWRISEALLPFDEAMLSIFAMDPSFGEEAAHGAGASETSIGEASASHGGDDDSEEDRLLCQSLTASSEFVKCGDVLLLPVPWMG